LPDSNSVTPWYGYVDVRDVARGLVAGIKVRGRNRILLNGEWFDHTDAIEYIAAARPELKYRLPTLTASGQTKAVVDNTRAMKILGIPPVKSWKESVLDTVDALVAVEKDWKEAGVDVDQALSGKPSRN
jgi:nucleoside-diphosphate-sugar epimerase